MRGRPMMRRRFSFDDLATVYANTEYFPSSASPGNPLESIVHVVFARRPENVPLGVEKGGGYSV
jgi:hypothetical protein